MGKTSVFQVRIRAVLAALVLTLFTVGPILDHFICAGEDGGSAAAQTLSDGATVSATSLDDHPGCTHAGEAGTCSHGHCHHSAVFAVVSPLRDHTPVVETRPHVLALSSPPAGDLKFGLKRPPRI